MKSNAYRENDLFYTDKPSKADVQCDCGQDFPLSSSLAFPSRNVFFPPSGNCLHRQKETDTVPAVKWLFLVWTVRLN